MELSSSNISNTYFVKQWQTWAGSLHRVLCMQGGDGDSSYAKNSEASASAITLCQPLLLSALQSMKLFFLSKEDADSIRVADLGCATGYNTLATMNMVVNTLTQRYLNACGFEPEFEAFFCDLPSNDFNSLFRSLEAMFADGKARQYYAVGVPGSFYHRLFPRGKLHVAVTLSALHWLSKIPDAVLDKTSRSWNRGRVWIEGAKKEVVEAYARQSEKDLEDFLRHRREEIVVGGILFILMAGRPGSEPPENQLDADSRAKHPFTVSMDQAWQDLINEGLIDEETRDWFNIPAYMRSVEEVEAAVKKCGGFEIKRIEYKRIAEHSEEKQEEWIKDPGSYARAKANLVRATLRPIVDAHIGPDLSEQLFQRFQNRVSSDTALLHKTCFYGVIIVSAIRV
ncbi:hypothetical protein SLA2020_135830 [Shorea laevis]